MSEAESDARNYVLTIENNPTEATQIAKATAEKLESKSVTLIAVVQSLGEYINDTNPTIRARAISYLVAVLTALSPKFLTRQQVQVLCEFLCDRIEDGGAIDGLAHLVGLDRFTDDMAKHTLKRLCEVYSGELQQKPQRERWPIYSLVNVLLEKKRKGIRAMGSESLSGIVTLVAGEKDPRNLMLIFSMLRVVMVEWDIIGHEEKLFDAVYAYFPITFRPPPNDPYGITAQDLKDRLKMCLASNGRLAPQAFPNLLDRLDATSETVKKDVLQALAACGLNYDPTTISQYSITLWDAVKYEVLQPQEPFLADEGLVVLQSIAICLSKSKNDNHGPTANPLVHYLKPVIKEALDHLSEPASRQAKASGDIFQAVASASIPSFEIIMQGVGPALLSLYQKADGIISQRAVLEVANKLFEAAIEVYGSWTVSSLKNPEGRANLLEELKDQLVAIYSQALMGTVKQEVSFRLTAVKGLLLLSQMRSLLQDNEIGLFIQYFDEIVVQEESYGRDELKKTVMAALSEISKFKPRLITDITFPAFMARLPDDEDQAAQMKDHRDVLEGLAEISTGRELTETLMRRLLNKLDLLFGSSERPEYPYTCAILSAAHYVLRRAVKDQSVSLDTYYDKIVVGFCSRAVQSPAGPMSNETVLDLLGRMMNLITRHSAPLRISITAENVYKLFRDPSALPMEAGEVFVLDPPRSALLSTWLLATLPRDMMLGVLQVTTIPTTFRVLVKFAANCEDLAVQLSCLRQITLYLNKHLPAPDAPLADDMLDTYTNRLKTETDPRAVEFAIRIIFSISKALILRLAPNTNQVLSVLVALLDAKEYGPQISRLSATGFSTILAPDDVLSKTNFAQIRLLAPQRVFQTLIPLISARFRDTQSPREKENYLIALAGILSTVSTDIVMPELPTLLPLLLQSLDVSDQTVKVATLDTLAVVITSNPSALEESGHLLALTRRLLTTASLAKTVSFTKGTVPPAVNVPRVRHLAARCLTLMPKHITTSSKNKGINPLLALKGEVLQGLMHILDDPRRDVRKEAVDARAGWIRGVDDVDSDEEDE